MGKYYFTVQHDAKAFKCYLDENQELWVIDGNGKPRTTLPGRKIERIEDAKEAAHKVIEAILREQT